MIRNKTFSNILILVLSLWALPASAVPKSVTLQVKIVKPNATGLEAPSVQFQITTLDPLGTCILYVENFNSISMTGSAGMAAFNLGLGVQTYSSVGASYADVFNNAATSIPCQGGGNYNPASLDRRKIIMQFNDGSAAGWQTVQAFDLNSVPFSHYAGEAEKLGGKLATDFTLNTAFPDCATTGKVLTFNGTAFTCVAAGAGAGTVTNVTSANTYLTVGTGTTTPVLTVNVGTVANTLAAGNDARILGAAQKANNLSDLASVATARTNLGLGTAAVLNAGAAATNLVQLDGAAKIPAALLPASAVTTGTPLVGDVTGTIGATVVSLVGTKTAAQVAQSVTDTLAATNLNTASTIVKRDASGNIVVGNVSATNVSSTNVSTQNNYLYDSTNTNRIILKAPGAGITDYTMTLPPVIGTANQILGYNNAGTVLENKSITAGAGVSVTHGAGGIQIAATGGSGTVTSVTSANTDIGVATTTTTPVLTLNSGTAANQILKLDGAAKIPAVDGSLVTNLNPANLSAAVAVNKGGTGATTAVAGLNNLLPSQAANAGKVLSTDGTNPSWVAAGGTGTVTSVTSANSYLSVATGTTTPALTLNVGAAANTVAAGDDSRITGAVQQTAYNGDIANVLDSNCAAGSTPKWNVVGDMWTCVAIGSLPASAITTGTVASARLGTGTADATTFLRGDGTWVAPSAGVGGSGTTGKIPKFTASGTLGDSIMSESASALTLNGTLALPATTSTVGQVTVNGNRFMHSYGGTFLGDRSGNFTNTGTSNVAMGFFTLKDLTTGSSNVAIGDFAGQKVTDGTQNTYVGDNVASQNISGTKNTMVGYNAGGNRPTGSSNTYIGTGVGQMWTGDQNTLVGDQAGNSGAGFGGSFNTSLGYQSAQGVQGTTNVLIGYQAGKNLATGNNNVIIGGNDGAAISGSSNNILIADGAGNERIRINSTGSVGIGTTNVTSPFVFLDQTNNGNIGVSANFTNAPGIVGAIAQQTAFQALSQNGANNVTNSYGVYAITANANGPMGTGIGVNAESTNIGTATMTNAMAGKFSVTRLAGNITNGYGVYVGTIQATNKYSIYASDATAPSYFAGNMDIGGTIKIAGGTPGAGKVLTSDAAGLASWATPSAGSVTSVTGTAPIAVATGTSTPVISIATANTTTTGAISSTDWNTFNGKMSSTLAPASIWVGNGSSVATAVGVTGDISLSNAGVSAVNKIKGQTVSATATTNGQVLRYDGANWTPNYLSMFDLRSTVTGTATFGAGCTTGQTLTWTSATDNLGCTNISLPVGQITGTLAATNGGTGQNTFAVGDLLYASTTTALSRLPASTSGYVLTSNGAGTAPSWQVVGTGVSGTAGKIAKFTSGTTVGDSLLTESAGQISVAGQINSTGNSDQTSNSPNISFNNGNSLYVAANCTAFALSNMVSGGNYSFAVQGTSGTCSFTHGADTVHYSGGVSNVPITAHTVFAFVKYGTHVYVTWVSF